MQVAVAFYAIPEPQSAVCYNYNNSQYYWAHATKTTEKRLLYGDALSDIAV
jgi:hypothetical protein